MQDTTERKDVYSRITAQITAARNLLPSLALLSCAPILNCIRNHAKTTPPISRIGWKS